MLSDYDALSLFLFHLCDLLRQICLLCFLPSIPLLLLVIALPRRVFSRFPFFQPGRCFFRPFSFFPLRTQTRSRVLLIFSASNLIKHSVFGLLLILRCFLLYDPSSLELLTFMFCHCFRRRPVDRVFLFLQVARALLSPRSTSPPVSQFDPVSPHRLFGQQPFLFKAAPLQVTSKLTDF